MSRTTRSVAILVALSFLAVPVTQAQDIITERNNPTNVSTPTDLYFHIFDTFNRFVINTQPMNSDHFEVGGTNFPTISGTPINAATETEYDFNTIYGTSTAGPVEYDFIENGKPRFHPERGIAKTVRIDPNYDADGFGTPAVVYLYIDARDVIGTDAQPNIMPSFTFRVQVRQGDDPGRNAELDSGQLIMSGETTVHFVEGGTGPLGATINQQFHNASGPDGNPVAASDGDGIYQIAIPMALDGGSGNQIPQQQAFNVRIDWWQLEDVFGPDSVAEGFIRLYADPTHLPRLHFSIFEAIYVSFIHPQVAAGTLLIHTGVNSPWGTYDVDADNITMLVEGPSVPKELRRVVATNEHVHNAHHLDAEITYLWRFRDEGAKLGQYQISMEVQNDAQTATATAKSGFVVTKKEAFGIDTEGNIVPETGNEESDTPGLGILATLALLGAAFVVRRR